MTNVRQQAGAHGGGALEADIGIDFDPEVIVEVGGGEGDGFFVGDQQDVGQDGQR